MSKTKIIYTFAIILFAISLPFVIIHLIAKPDVALTPLQHMVAALANFFGPWGVAIVRLVDFPNAGLRSFSWSLALGLTVLGVALVILPLRVTIRGWQILFSFVWGLFVAAWFIIGLSQIADGLL